MVGWKQRQGREGADRLTWRVSIDLTASVGSAFAVAYFERCHDSRRNGRGAPRRARGERATSKRAGEMAGGWGDRDIAGAGARHGRFRSIEEGVTRCEMPKGRASENDITLHANPHSHHPSSRPSHLCCREALLPRLLNDENKTRRTSRGRRSTKVRRT